MKSPDDTTLDPAIRQALHDSLPLREYPICPPPLRKRRRFAYVRPSKRTARRRARDARSEAPRIGRVLNSVHLPLVIGVASFLAVAIVVGSLVGQVDDGEFEVPRAMLDYQEAVTHEVADSIRRGANEGVTDLAQVANTIEELGSVDPARLKRLLESVASTYDRYQSLYVLKRGVGVVASVGASPKLSLLDTNALFEAPGMSDARKSKNLPLIQQWAPVNIGAGLAVIGQYDYSYLRRAMESARPGGAWVVNRNGEVVVALGGFAPFSRLPRASLRNAAGWLGDGGEGALRTGGSIDRQEVVGYAPVTGDGPAGSLGWGVITSRRVLYMSLPHARFRREAMVVAIVVAALTLVVFGWLWMAVIRPVARLRREAERLSKGQLLERIDYRWDNGLALIARALERLRTMLLQRGTPR